MKQSFLVSRVALPSLLAVFSAATGGCQDFGQKVKIGGEVNNPAKIETSEEFEAKAKTIQNGMTKEAAFQACGIKQNLFTLLSTDEGMKAVFGNAMPQPHTDEELRKIADTVDDFEVFTLPFTDIKKKGAINYYGETTEYQNGFDRKLTVIFENNAVRRAFITGSPTIDRTKSQNVIWESGPSFVGKVIGIR